MPIDGIRGLRAPECLDRAGTVARHFAQIRKRKPCKREIGRKLDRLHQHIDCAVPISARGKLDRNAIAPIGEEVAGRLEQRVDAYFHGGRYDIS